MERDYYVTVCNSCLTASCWHGEFYCQRAKTAGTVEKLASELRALDAEHPDNYSRAKLLEVAGHVREPQEPKP